jgi:hypothetical protein
VGTTPWRCIGEWRYSSTTQRRREKKLHCPCLELNFGQAHLELRRFFGRYTCNDNIWMDLEETSVWRCGLDSNGSQLGTVTSSCEQGNEPSGSIKGRNFFTSWATIIFSRKILLDTVSSQQKEQFDKKSYLDYNVHMKKWWMNSSTIRKYFLKKGENISCWM